MGFCFQIARGRAREGEPTMVLVRFQYLRSDSECKLRIGQFNFICSKMGQNLSDGSQDICKETGSNLTPFNGF